MIEIRADETLDSRGRPSGDGRLTRRELEVLILVASGLPAWRIGSVLNISRRTVEQHIVIMMKKIRASNRCELIARCCIAGILNPDNLPFTWSGGACSDTPLGTASEAVVSAQLISPEVQQDSGPANSQRPGARGMAVMEAAAELAG